MKLINYWHNKEQQVLIKYLDDDNVKRYKKIDYEAYFWVLKTDLEKVDEVLKGLIVSDKFSKSESEITFTVGEEENEWVKIYYQPINEIYLKSITKSIIDKLNSNHIKHFELDLFPADCYMLDNPEIEISDEYDILYYDIETDDRKGGVEIGRDRILSICGIDNKGNKFEITDENETAMLERFMELLEKYDIIVGWNSEKFDFPYIKKRVSTNGIFGSFKTIISIDLMKVFMGSFAVSHTFGKKYIESFALDYIAREYLQDQKIEIGDGGGYGGRIWRLYNEDLPQLLKYNMQDCILLKKLDEKFHLLRNEIEVARYVGFPLSKTRSASAIVDNVLLRECRKRKIHWKTSPNYGESEKPHQEGGAVLEPIPGLHNNINIYDFNSLYPNIFRTFNISPDTVLETKEEGCIELPNKINYSNKTVGFVPEVLDKLTTLRLKYKAEKVKLKAEGKKEEATVMDFQETALKVIILSIYGIMGAPFSRYFDIRVANSITQTGQHLITNIAKELNSNGFSVKGGDTDSLFFQLNDESKREEVEILIKNTIQRIVDSTHTKRPNTLKMSHEKTLSKFLILSKGDEGEGAKKKYAGRCIWDDGKICDEMYFRGIELHKASELQITKAFLKEILTYVLWNEPQILELEKIIKKYKNKILNRDVKAEDITIVKKVGKMASEYKTVPEHVRLATEKMKETGEFFYVGQKVPHIIITNNPLRAIHKRDFKGDYDERYYWENQIWNPVYRVVKTIFPKYSWEKWKEGCKEMQQTLW